MLSCATLLASRQERRLTDGPKCRVARSTGTSTDAKINHEVSWWLKSACIQSFINMFAEGRLSIRSKWSCRTYVHWAPRIVRVNQSCPTGLSSTKFITPTNHFFFHSSRGKKICALLKMTHGQLHRCNLWQLP